MSSVSSCDSSVLTWKPREVAQHVDEVASPKRLDALLGRDAREAVHDARVARHLAGDDLGVAVLRLDDELYALDRRRARLGDGARDAARQEVGDEGAAHGVRSLSGFFAFRVRRAAASSSRGAAGR